MTPAPLPSLLLALLAASTTVAFDPGERGVGSHGHGARPAPRGVLRGGAGAAGAGDARLPIPTPQEIDALRQLVRILASLAGAASGTDSQLVEESASFLSAQSPHRPSAPAPAHARRRSPAAAAAAALAA